jgi:hypothetical protein
MGWTAFVEQATYLPLEIVLAAGLSEHLTYINAVGLRELTRWLPDSLAVEYSLHRIEHIAAVFRRGEIRQRLILVYCRDDLRHFSFHGLFRDLDLVDLLVAIFGQISQILLETYHAVVGRAIRILLDAVLFGNLTRLILTLAEAVAEIANCVALLFRKWTGSGIT